MKNNLFDKLEYYKLLDVSFDTPEDVLRQKYKEKAKFWHPDHNSAPNALDMFQRLSVAYDVLKDNDTRLKYTLLSIIYKANNFPDMNALTLIRNMHGQEDINLRAFHLIEITGTGVGHESIDKMYYCGPNEAFLLVRDIAKHNWLYGFWGITAFFANIRALFHNISTINNREDNLTLLLHNSLVYKQEGKEDEAYTLALLAREYATDKEKIYINYYLDTFGTPNTIILKKWKFNKLVRVQLIYPFFVFLAALLLFTLIGGKKYQDSRAHNGVKQVIKFHDGQKMFSDMAVAKFFDIPVNVYDKDKLYHLVKDAPSMHGADRSFDVFKQVSKGTTVRVTGYTADKKWMRVMFDSGEMAFIESDNLEKGIGNEIPLWSKIYKEE